MTEDFAEHYIEQFCANRPNMVILFVDDQPNSRLSVLYLLQGLKLKVLLARNGEEAMRLYEEYGPETIGCVVSDHQMPELTGEQLFWRLKQKNSRIRMVLCSGGHPPCLKAMVNSGLKGFLRKPFAKGELETAIAIALS